MIPSFFSSFLLFLLIFKPELLWPSAKPMLPPPTGLLGSRSRRFARNAAVLPPPVGLERGGLESKRATAKNKRFCFVRPRTWRRGMCGPRIEVL
ncbi:hypothetical protein M440DRAFT_1209818 [Trichoderma longibrachiatum ATCC 18648]|uniref:Secreted protein n=1 Tax=Trichoderma longibrachiatum ATCC 18648 TaxID=983965 RepID=A0A2T4C6Z3_TRILO|nr:hypothetical protein M440DRAFT_1209818 [Trichoderma longibrachiatum ATCC 18648]